MYVLFYYVTLTQKGMSRALVRNQSRLEGLARSSKIAEDKWPQAGPDTSAPSQRSKYL